VDDAQDETRFCPHCASRAETLDRSGRKLTYMCGTSLRRINAHRREIRQSARCRANLHETDMDETRSLMEDPSPF
jgi:hypothetical protein